MLKKNSSRRKRMARILIGVLLFFASLYIISAFSIIFGDLQIKRSNMPHSVFLFDITKHPVATIIAAVASAFLSKFLSEPILEKKSHKRVYGDIKLAKGKTQGANERMGIKEKEKLFRTCPYNDPEGLIVAVDKESNELLTIPWNYEDPNDALTNNNTVIFGDTGSRKTSGFIEPNIYSCIAAGYTIATTDPKGEIYEHTAPAAIAKGYKVLLLDLVGGHFQHSDGWDVLKPVRESNSPEEVSQIIVDQIVRNIGSIKDDFWNDMNTNLLQLLILTVAIGENYTPRTSMNNAGKGRTFREVFALLEDEELEKTLNNLMITERNRKYLQPKFLSWSKHSQKESIRAGLQSKLSLINTENLLSVLSEDEIDFRRMNEEKSILYIVASDKDSTYKSALSLVSAMMFREIMEYADEQSTLSLQRPFYMFFEEFKNIGYIPDLAVKMAVIRSRMINIIFCFQNLGQIQDQYGSMMGGKHEWETILGACALQLCCGVNDAATAEYFSLRSGDMSIVQNSRTQNVSSLVPGSFQWSPNESKREEIRTRRTYLPSEINAIQKTEILISPGKHNSIIENKYYTKAHPLSRYKAIDKNGEIIRLSPSLHIPLWRQRQINEEKYKETGIQQEIIVEKINVREFKNAQKSEKKKLNRKEIVSEIKKWAYEEEKENNQSAVRMSDFFGDKVMPKNQIEKNTVKKVSQVVLQSENYCENDCYDEYENELF